MSVSSLSHCNVDLQFHELRNRPVNPMVLGLLYFWYVFIVPSAGIAPLFFTSNYSKMENVGDKFSKYRNDNSKSITEESKLAFLYSSCCSSEVRLTASKLQK